jgi:hypothetical protein
MTHEELRATVTPKERALAVELFDEMDARASAVDDLNVFSVAFELWSGLTELLLSGRIPAEELQAAIASHGATRPR